MLRKAVQQRITKIEFLGNRRWKKADLQVHETRHVATGGRGGGATAPPKVFLAPPREIWEVFVIVDRREFTSTA